MRPLGDWRYYIAKKALIKLLKNIANTRQKLIKI